MNDAKYCKDCKNMKCPEGRVNCKYPDAIACEFYSDTPAIVFQAITESPEVLAVEFVEPYTTWDSDGRLNKRWKTSFRDLSGRLFDTREEAIAATVAAFNSIVEKGGER